MKLIHYIINNTIVYDAYYYNICTTYILKCDKHELVEM